jgi:hypothetical protein
MIFEQHPDLDGLLAELEAEDAAGVRGELVGPDPSVPPLTLRGSRTVPNR